MSVPKAFTLAVVVILGLSTFAQAAPRARSGGVQNGYGASSGASSYGGGGYSSDPKTRELEILADKYKPGW